MILLDSIHFLFSFQKIKNPTGLALIFTTFTRDAMQRALERASRHIWERALPRVPVLGRWISGRPARPGLAGPRGRGLSTEGGKAQSKTPSGPVDWYLSMLDKKPLITKAITSCALTGGGDLLCQLAIEGDGFDPARSARFGFLGLVLVGPGLHYWYNFLFRAFPPAQYPGVLGVARRLALDQTVWAGGFLAVFFAANAALEGQPQTAAPKIQKEWWPSMQMNWKLWIPANFVNFMFVPLRGQVLFANCVALVWNTYLSLASHRE